MNRRTFMKLVVATVVSTALPAPTWCSGGDEWLDGVLKTHNTYTGPPQSAWVTPKGYQAIKDLALKNILCE